MSKIIEDIRDDLAALHDAGAVGKVTLREFDSLCPVAQPVQRHLAQRLVMHARVQALRRPDHAQVVRPHHPAHHRARLVQVARGEQLLRRRRQNGVDAPPRGAGHCPGGRARLGGLP